MKGVRDVDRGYRKLFQRALKNDPHVVTIGVQGEDASTDHGGISNARLAGVHEFGAQIDTGRAIVNIPERSFLRSTITEHRATYTEIARKLAQRVLAGAFDIPTALGLLGEKISSDVKRKIEKGIDPPNAASTIARKGSNVPLIDTAQMKNAITYQVRKQSE